MTADDFRQMVLDMHDAVEREHMGHPDFRVNGRIFATLHTGDRFGMVKLAPEEQRVLLKTHPSMFVPSAGAWGRQGCTNVRLDVADEAPVRGAIVLAWQAAAARPPAKPRARAAKKPVKRRSRP